jgi:hypothetical protein
VSAAFDRLERVEYSSCTTHDFINRFEAPGLPCVIVGALDDWPAVAAWHPEVNRLVESVSIPKLIRFFLSYLSFFLFMLVVYH